MKITDHLSRIYRRTYPHSKKENRRKSTYNQLKLQTLAKISTDYAQKSPWPLLLITFLPYPDFTLLNYLPSRFKFLPHGARYVSLNGVSRVGPVLYTRCVHRIDKWRRCNGTKGPTRGCWGCNTKRVLRIGILVGISRWEGVFCIRKWCYCLGECVGLNHVDLRLTLGGCEGYCMVIKNTRMVYIESNKKW